MGLLKDGKVVHIFHLSFIIFHFPFVTQTSSCFLKGVDAVGTRQGYYALDAGHSI
jgi:hypothetical protein